MKQLGQAGKDLSALFLYVCADKYLKAQGKLGFVITQTIFQSTAGNEFRRFRLPDNGGIKVEKGRGLGESSTVQTESWKQNCSCGH